ncbi:dynein light chain tctex-type 1 protein [Kipferlia bialata]|uniref:Dynein light chain tctex-type 1 protein n=1 Tax=Kipferlia bialata TaxID=797122 RepID=A0A9K3D1L3_9EUKA|nr:dynein light chain tctex-type 1 protein [Kipferlia bialata]|eukprot:g8256.t1
MQAGIKVNIQEIERANAPTHRFSPAVAEETINGILKVQLKGQVYDSDHVSQLSRDIADEVKRSLKDASEDRYKFCVQLVIVEQRGQGIRVMNRCFWDKTNDKFVSVSFQTEHLICLVTAYAIYFS